MNSNGSAEAERVLTAPAVLTTREADVYECVVNGLSNAEIAATLFISEATVKTHVRNILAKLGLKSRSKLMAQAWHGAPEERERASNAGGTKRRLAVIATTGVALALISVAMLVAAPWSSPPASSQPRTRAVSGLSVQPFIADVEPVEAMPIRDGVPLYYFLDEGPGPDAVVADVAYLGVRDLYFGVGLLSEAGRVCLNLVVVDPESYPDVPSRRTCSDFADFTHSGLEIDMGAWSLKWYPDGTASWDGT